MKKNNIFYTLALMAVAMMPLASCDDYLDVMPDSRTEVDTEDKVASLLVSAYPTSGNHMMLTETMSDNIDHLGEGYEAYTSRFMDQVYFWQPITETNNDGDNSFWVGSYACIAAANLALESIEEIAGDDASKMTTKLKECKGEALICRAYNHFMLVNMFAMNYNSKTSGTDLGVPYVEVTEKTMAPEYVRGTVAEVYEKIERDLVEGLSLIGDTHLSVPKYHFTKQAAYAFAARFYLYYEKWEESVKYANLCLGSNPSTMLRDWDALYNLPDIDAQTNAYIKSDVKSNLLLFSAISAMGIWCNGYSYNSSYSHNEYLSQTEGIYANQTWGDVYSIRASVYAGKRGPLNIVFIPKLPYLFEELDAVNHTGYYRTVYPVFKADLTLLERAEANIMLKDYDAACKDINMWVKNYTTATLTLNTDTIHNFYKNMPYYAWDNSTSKKRLNPAFAWDGEGSLQESMLHQVLNCKRIEMIYEGYRWFDVKRYGIKIYRRIMGDKGVPFAVVDSLMPDDQRRAIQIPQDAITTGIKPNPRVTDDPSQYVSKVEKPTIIK